MSNEYTLAAKCLSEGSGMAIVIFMSESILANHVLPNSKGHSIGFGWVALGFGCSIYVGTKALNNSKKCHSFDFLDLL